MTLFTKPACRLCEQLKSRFDLQGMAVAVEVLEVGDAGALAHLAWHGLVEKARKSLPLLVLDDSSAVADFVTIEKLLISKAEQCGIKYAGAAPIVPLCDTGGCALN
jgi:hypothetical protein